MKTPDNDMTVVRTMYFGVSRVEIFVLAFWPIRLSLILTGNFNLVFAGKIFSRLTE